MQRVIRVRSIPNLPYRGPQSNPQGNLHKKNSNKINKTISHKAIANSLITQSNPKSKLILRYQKSSKQNRSISSLKIPYQNFVKQLKINLPTPKQKFYQFMQIAPFNRVLHHLQLIQHFLKQYRFFKNHPNQILSQLAKKVKICKQSQLQNKQLVIVQSGQCLYQKQLYKSGDILPRDNLNINNIIIENYYQKQPKFITVIKHQYEYVVSQYLQKQKQKFKIFLSNAQMFKMFTSKAFGKFMDTLTLRFFVEGESLYKFGDQTSHLYIVMTGMAVRRVIVEIDKMNKIPLKKSSKIVKILSKSYEHKIEFITDDLIGITEIIGHIQTRKENIKIQKDSIILGLDKNVFCEYLDDYIIDRLKKYNLKKYPVTYDKLCEKYQKQMISKKQEEQRKIDALKNTINNTISEKKNQKIQQIIQKYHQNIKKSEFQNLLNCKIQERRVQRQ